MSSSRQPDKHSYQTLYDVLASTASIFPDRQAYVGAGGKGEAYTYAQVNDLVRRLAVGLSGPRYQDQPEIGLLSENRPEWPIAYLAIVAAGKTVVPIDANLKDNEISYLVGHAGLQTVFASESFVSFLGSLEKGLKVISLEPDSESWQGLQGDKSVFWPKAESSATAALIYTSGTTGTPKAVMLTHRNLISNLTSIQQSLFFDENDVFLSVLPLHHTFESTCGFLTPILAGSLVVYARSLKSKEILEDIRNNQISIMCGVPLLFEKMYQSIERAIKNAPVFRRLLFRTFFGLSAATNKVGFDLGKPLFASLRKKAGLDTIRLFVSGGAALPSRIARFFNLLGFCLMPGYGLTECSPVVSVNRPGKIKFGSSGPLLEGIELKIDNPDVRGVGEILVKGENNTPGYKNNPTETAKLIRDGWLYTGDLGCLKGGHLWITGRAKNLIVSAAGKNIYPEELEERLLESPMVQELVVFGRTKEGKQGEEVRAVIVPDLEYFLESGQSEADPVLRGRIRTEIEGLVTQFNSEVSDYKRISGFEVSFVELEKTSTKKIKRFLYS